MSTLALDIATVTGWAFGSAGEKPQHGAFTCPSTSDDLGWFGCEYRDFLRDMIRTRQPKQIVYEAPILPPAQFDRAKGRIVHKTSLPVVRKLNGLIMVTEMTARDEGFIPKNVSEITAGQWRKLFLGQLYPHSGKRDDFKRAAIAACRQMEWNPNGSDDAEALGIWFVVTRCGDAAFAAEEAIARMANA